MSKEEEEEEPSMVLNETSGFPKTGFQNVYVQTHGGLRLGKRDSLRASLAEFSSR